MLHEVNIAGLILDPTSNTPIIVLKTLDEKSTIPIWIGLLEAASIASTLQKINFDRPMTHDLFKQFIDHLKIKVPKVEVSDILDKTYYAKIFFELNDSSFTMDARPSDAIAIAVRYNAPIFVSEQVLQKSNTSSDNVGEIIDKSEDGKKWGDYLKNLSAEDFGRYKV